ncbi:MAG: hypothetical protein ACUVS2_10250 [Candidatus Flexifilum sp.]
MFDAYVDQLNDRDPQRRREAIIALGRSKNLAAIPHLSKVFREDPDNELRELARKAATYIRQNNPDVGASTEALPGRSSSAVRLIGDAAAGSAAGAAAGGFAEPSEQAQAEEPRRKGPVRGRTYNVPPDKVRLARGMTEAALDANMRGDNDKAMKQLALALATNPNLVNDGYYMNIAATVTGLEGDGAIQMIVDADQRKTYIKEKVTEKKRAKIDRHMSEVRTSNWGSVGLEALTYVLINVVGPVLVLLVASELAQNAFGSLNNPELSREEAATLRELRAQLPLLAGGATVPLLAGSALITGLSSIIGFAIQGIFIHLIARLLGGHGTFVHVMNELLRFLNRYFLILYLLLGIFVVVLFLTIGSPLLLCVVIPLTLYQFYLIFGIVGVVGKAYNFGTAMGCVTVLLTAIVLALIGAGLGILLGSAAQQAFQSLLT